MTYKNYLTTPSGRYCKVQDISNGDYMILVKYIQAEDYESFYKCLYEITKRDIPDFDDYHLVDKCYVWIAMCMYSVRATIEVNNNHLGSQDVSIVDILNNIESQYKNNTIIEYKLNDNFTLGFCYPKKFSFENNSPIIDYCSGLQTVNGQYISDDQKETLIAKLPTRYLTFIEGYLREKFYMEVDLLRGVPMNSLSINLLGEGLLANVVSFYRMTLDVFYQVRYAVIRHLRMSYSDFMKISQVESTILLKHVAEENRVQEENVKNGDIQSIGRMIGDND